MTRAPTRRAARTAVASRANVSARTGGTHRVIVSQVRASAAFRIATTPHAQRVQMGRARAAPAALRRCRGWMAAAVLRAAAQASTWTTRRLRACL
eukprot:801715-Prymnesium_polylepis.1